jgi:curved DNA-binding protein
MRGQDLSLELTIDFMDAFKGCEKKVDYVHGGKKQGVKVKVPAGIASGQKLRLAGKGAPGPVGSTPGDMFFTIKVADHPVFKRDGSDVVIDQEIKISDAVFGTSLDVETPHGKRKVKIPAGIQSGTKLRLKGLGMPEVGKKAAGHSYVKVSVVTPNDLTDKQKQLFEQLGKEGC